MAEGSHRGVVSKIDLLFAIASYITKADLVRFFENAKLVLGEDYHALDLPEDQQWEANDKKCQYSEVLRKGIGETLILLAVHGNELFRSRFDFDCEHETAKLVEALFSPLSLNTLQAQSSFSVYSRSKSRSIFGYHRKRFEN